MKRYMGSTCGLERGNNNIENVFKSGEKKGFGIVNHAFR